jgi:hypothetical protein
LLLKILGIYFIFLGAYTQFGVFKGPMYLK